MIMDEEMIVYPCAPCPHCGGDGARDGTRVQVPLAGLVAWGRGTPIQEALPSLTTGERELMLTGVHESCWDKFAPYDGVDPNWLRGVE